MVYKKQACTLQRSHTRRANLFLTLCHPFLGPSHTADTEVHPNAAVKIKTLRAAVSSRLIGISSTGNGWFLEGQHRLSPRLPNLFSNSDQKKYSTSIALKNFTAASRWVSKQAGAACPTWVSPAAARGTAARRYPASPDR